MVKLRAKVVLSKDECNCKGFYHPGDLFEATKDKAADLIKKGHAEKVEVPAEKPKK